MCWTSEGRSFGAGGGLVCGLLLALSGAGSTPALADLTAVERDRLLRAEIKSATDVAMRHLRFQQQPDGSWDQSVVATALAVRALMRSPRKYTADDGPFVAGALEYLAAHARVAGSSGARRAPLLDTALALLALAESASPGYRPVIEELRESLVDELMESAEAPRIDRARPLRELMLALDALRAGGLPATHPIWRRALERAERCWSEPEPTAPGEDSRAGREAPVAACGDEEPAERFAAAKILATAGAPAAVPAKLARGLLPGPVEAGEAGPLPAHEGYFAAEALAAWTRAGGLDDAARGSWRHQLTADLKEGQAFEGYWHTTGRDWPASDPTLGTSFAILALSLVDEH